MGIKFIINLHDKIFVGVTSQKFELLWSEFILMDVPTVINVEVF